MADTTLDDSFLIYLAAAILAFIEGPMGSAFPQADPGYWRAHALQIFTDQTMIVIYNRPKESYCETCGSLHAESHTECLSR